MTVHSPWLSFRRNRGADLLLEELTAHTERGSGHGCWFCVLDSPDPYGEDGPTGSIEFLGEGALVGTEDLRSQNKTSTSLQHIFSPPGKELCSKTSTKWEAWVVEEFQPTRPEL